MSLNNNIISKTVSLKTSEHLSTSIIPNSVTSVLSELLPGSIFRSSFQRPRKPNVLPSIALYCISCGKMLMHQFLQQRTCHFDLNPQSASGGPLNVVRIFHGKKKSSLPIVWALHCLISTSWAIIFWGNPLPSSK
jgi:hypothetical protein